MFAMLIHSSSRYDPGPVIIGPREYPVPKKNNHMLNRGIPNVAFEFKNGYFLNSRNNRKYNFNYFKDIYIKEAMSVSIKLWVEKEKKIKFK